MGLLILDHLLGVGAVRISPVPVFDDPRVVWPVDAQALAAVGRVQGQQEAGHTPLARREAEGGQFRLITNGPVAAGMDHLKENARFSLEHLQMFRGQLFRRGHLSFARFLKVAVTWCLARVSEPCREGAVAPAVERRQQLAPLLPIEEDAIAVSSRHRRSHRHLPGPRRRLSAADPAR